MNTICTTAFVITYLQNMNKIHIKAAYKYIFGCDLMHSANNIKYSINSKTSSIFCSYTINLLFCAYEYANNCNNTFLYSLHNSHGTYCRHISCYSLILKFLVYTYEFVLFTYVVQTSHQLNSTRV